MGGRPYFLLYNPAVSSYTKDKSSTASSFRKKCPTGTKSSMVSMWYFNCTVDPPRFSLLYHIFNQIDRKTTGYGINDRLRTQEIVPASAFSPNNSLTASPVVLEQSARLSRSLSVCFAPRSSSSCRTSLRLRDRATSSQLLMLPVPPRQSGAPVSTAGILYNLASDLWSTASVLPFYPFAAVPRENKSTSFKNSSIPWDCFSSVKLPNAWAARTAVSASAQPDGSCEISSAGVRPNFHANISIVSALKFFAPFA